MANHLGTTKEILHNLTLKVDDLYFISILLLCFNWIHDSYNGLSQLQQKQDIDSTWPSSSPALRSQHFKAAPVLMKQTISSCSDHKLQHIGGRGYFLTTKLASGPVDGPFPCVTADLMRKKIALAKGMCSISWPWQLWALQDSWSHHWANLFPSL